MLNMTPLDSKGKNSAGEAIAEYLRLTEYYQNAKGEQVSSAQWLGGGAVTLGLADAKFEESDMLTLMKGFGPDGKALVQNAGDPERRIGTDMTFSADKSVSLIYAIATPEERERILEAHHKAVADELVITHPRKRGYILDAHGLRRHGHAQQQGCRKYP